MQGRDIRYLAAKEAPRYQPAPVMQVLSDVLPVCEPGLCCADTPEDSQLAAPVQVLSLVSASWTPEPSPLTQELFLNSQGLSIAKSPILDGV